VPSNSFSEILTAVRGQNLGWRFFVDSVNKLREAGEANELFLVKALIIVQGYFQ